MKWLFSRKIHFPLILKTHFLFLLPPIGYLKIRKWWVYRLWYLERISHKPWLRLPTICQNEINTWVIKQLASVFLFIFCKEQNHKNKTLWFSKKNRSFGGSTNIDWTLTLLIINGENSGCFSDLMEKGHFSYFTGQLSG